jgi:SAM-dependent methyltransferase
MSTSPELREKYDHYYDGANHWRALGAVDKADNIATLCYGRRFQDVIEIGAGEGSVLARLDALAFAPNLYALEISKSGVEAMRQRPLARLRDVRQFDGYHVPYPDKRFDLAIATHVLEHVEHERLFLRELMRTSKAVLIEVPLEDTLRVAKAVRNDIGHINFYRRDTLLALLASCGLRPVRFQLFDYSFAVKRHHRGVVRALGHHLARRTLLRTVPRLAELLFTYHMAVLAECPRVP